MRLGIQYKFDQTFNTIISSYTDVNCSDFLLNADIPTVLLHMGSIPNSSHINEGMDVYFECNIKSNPWVNNISWTHNVSCITRDKRVVVRRKQKVTRGCVFRSRYWRTTCLLACWWTTKAWCCRGWPVAGLALTLVWPATTKAMDTVIPSICIYSVSRAGC